MPFKLTIPVPDSNANLTVETRPKQVKEWLDRLPTSNAFEAARSLRDALSTVNRQNIPDETRLKLLELYRETIYALLPGLEERFSSTTLPLPEKQRQTANVARELLMEVGYGYKIILLEHINKRLNFGPNRQLPQLIQRALAALSSILMICYETYAPTPAGIWSEMHQLYRYAVQLNVQDETLSEVSSTSSINLTYKQSLLLALADPYRLMQGEVAKVMDYLARFGDQAHLMPLAQTTGPAGFFLVRLDTDKPPKAIAQNTTVMDARNDILLNTIDLARVMHQSIVKLESGEIPASLGLPAAAKDPAYVDLMRRLIRHWGIAPKRHFSRLANQTKMDICAGIRPIHYFLSARQHGADGSTARQDAEITVQFASSLIDKASQQTFTSTQWTILNESAGGLALSKVTDEPIQIRVGELVGLKPEKSTVWNVGVVRWVQSDNPTHLELGVQMLAPEVAPVTIKATISNLSEVFQPALLLPEIPLLKQPPTLLAARGEFQEQREFQLQQHSSISTIRATKLLEQTISFEQFQFKSS